jgi:hypothetical protein
MNENPELASNWKGRILLSVWCEETEKPIAKVTKIDEEILKESRKFMKDKTYDIIAEIGQAVGLPKPKKYQVKLIVGGCEFTTAEPKI